MKQTTGHSKIKQLKELSLFCNYIRSANKYIIKEIYKNPKNFQANYNYKDYSQYNIESKLNSCVGVYKIQLSNTIYIGSTISGFRKRFIKHMNNSKNILVFNLLKNNALYEIVWIAENNESEKEIRRKEKEYIKYYSNNKDWICINQRDIVKKYKNIKVLGINYEKAIKILKDNHLLSTEFEQ
jgi:hypothetical protein